MFPPVAERPKLRATLDQLSGAVEDLLLGGLTTASNATRQTLAGAMQEAARMRLLRLGAILRVLADDLNRFNTQDPLLSRRRLTLFLNRGWLIARGLSHALETGNEKEYDRLNLTPTTQPLASIDLVCLGAVKKVTAAVVQFQFRFRALTASGSVKIGDSLAWSFNQSVKKADIAPEAHLHLAQKQKFTPASLLERKIVTVQNAVVVPDEVGGWRIALNDQSKVTTGAAFTNWAQFLDWSPAPASQRLAKQSPGPLDLDTELQEEVVLRDYQIGEPGDGDEPGTTVYPITAGPLNFRAIVGPVAEGKTLRKNLDDLRQVAPSKRPPLYGLMHYERCRLVVQALTTFGKSGPEYLTISQEKVDIGSLLRELF
jgi:hypothetical protein